MSSTLSVLYHATSSGKCRVCVTSLFHLHGVCAGTDAGLPVESHFCMFKNGLLISQQVEIWVISMGTSGAASGSN